MGTDHFTDTIYALAGVFTALVGAAAAAFWNRKHKGAQEKNQLAQTVEHLATSVSSLEASRQALIEELDATRTEMAGLRSENRTLAAKVEELTRRLADTCPACGVPLVGA